MFGWIETTRLLLYPTLPLYLLSIRIKDQAVEVLSYPVTLSGVDVLPGFTLTIQ
jgi:hypothetical protein